MDRLKKFLTEKKVNKNFKRAGAGHRLCDDTSKHASIHPGNMQRGPQSQGGHQPSVDRIAAADVAAQAAFKRMNLGAKQETVTQRNIRLRVSNFASALKELEEERRAREQEINRSDASTQREPNKDEFAKVDVREFEHSNAVKGVFFTCELLGDDIVLTRDEMKQNVEAFLRSQMDEDSIVASALMLFSLNGSEKRKVATETLQKYIQNIIENPDQPKFRRIRLANKAFQERVLAAKGGREFLEACGFEERMEPFSEGAELEEFLVINDDKAEDVASLVQALDVLQTGQPVPIKLHRNPAIYRLEPNQLIPNPKLPPDFFELSGVEFKKEQALKTAQVEKLTTLRTREMRERDELLRSYRYKYTLLRIKFPNHFFLQIANDLQARR
ncbi:unnamed protein product [Toxocara canis]|uniref:PUB domain-containing protein n=1 Tax=Toxocara canis TaxID=6265 RepID=A0A183TZV3_TOXCA|nr:unnamed protein product [Toxocara canis]